MARLPFARRLLLPFALALAMLGGLGATAAALPGDPPIATLSPPNGATVPANDLGLEVTFTCPAYTKEVEEGEEGDDPKRTPGTADDYGVHFSTSDQLGPDGLLTTTGFGDEGEGLVDVAADKVTCNAELSLPDKPLAADLYRGTVYWQAYRACEGCDPAEYETGPVNSMLVVPNVESPDLELEDHVYAGYLTKVSFSTFSDLSGASFVLERWRKDGWAALDQVPASSSGEANFFVKLKQAGPTQLRVVVIAPGVEVGLEPQKLTVRKLGGKSSVDGTDDGFYEVAKKERKTAPARFKVSGEGTVLTDLVARMPATCTSGTSSARASAKVVLKRARIAPDGTVVGEMAGKGTTPALVTLAGDLHDKHFSGELTTSYLNCTGSRTIEADLVP